MFLWHVGASTFLFRWIFRDPAVDLRFLAVGAVLPNLVDLPLALALGFPDGAHRLWAHALVVPISLMFVLLVVTRRGPTRKRWMALTVGVFFHLLLDQMWALPETLLWPFLGTGFSDMGVASFGDLVDSAVDVWAIVGEVVGLAYLAFVWGWAPPEDRAAFTATGVLRLGAPRDPAAG
ncbi:MAG: metal-dependent hydrolase [Acidimicrobiia bacterium]